MIESTQPTTRAELSVVVPAYNETEALPELHRRLTATLDRAGIDWELVVVDDMSTDGTREYLRELAQGDPRVRGVFLSRNFGLASAHMAGLAHSSGAWTAVMDADLQDQPEAIPRLLEVAEEGGYDVVYALRAIRGEGRLFRLASAVFYRLFRRLSEVPPPSAAGAFSVLSGRVVRELVSLPERNVFFPGLRAYVGYRQTGVPVDRPDRATGRPRVSLRGKVAYGMNALFAFSNAPLRLATWLGLAIAGAMAALALLFVYFKLFTDKAIPGFTALITALLFLGGVQLLTLGVIGEYLGRVYNEVKRRPSYVVEERVNLESPRSEGEAPPPSGDAGPLGP